MHANVLCMHWFVSAAGENNPSSLDLLQERDQAWTIIANKAEARVSLFCKPVGEMKALVQVGEM